MNPALLIGAGAAVILLASGSKKSSSKRRPARSCPPLAPGGGTMAGFEYEEFATGGASLNERLPIVVFFHSLATRPSAFVKHLDDLSAKVRVILPKGRETYGSGPAWWTLRSRTQDQESLAQMMDFESDAMANFIEEANYCLGGVGKPLISGFSQGGMMAYAVAAKAPGLVRAAVPVNGWLPVDLWPDMLPPTYAIHGEKDTTVDFERTEDFILRASQAGLPIEWMPIPGKGHSFNGATKDAWFETMQALTSNASKAAA